MNDFIVKIVLPVAILVAGAMITLTHALGNASDVAVLIGAGAAILIGALGSKEAIATYGRRMRNHRKLRQQHRYHRQVRQARAQRKLCREEGFEMRVVNGNLVNLRS